MLLTYLRKILMILIISGFATNSFAMWNWNRNVTKCHGDACRHTVVHKQCNNGHCKVYKHNNTWRR